MQLIYLCNIFTVPVNGTRAYCAVLCNVLNTCTHSLSPEHMYMQICPAMGRTVNIIIIFWLFFPFFKFTSRRCCFVSVGRSWKLSATWQNLLPKILIRKLRNTEYSACTFSCWPNYKIVCWFSAKCHIMSGAGARSLVWWLPLLPKQWTFSLRCSEVSWEQTMSKNL